MEQEEQSMSNETTGTEVATTETKEVGAILGGRLGKQLQAAKELAPTPVMELLEQALGEGENAFKTDEYFEKAQAMLDKTGLLPKYLIAKGVETDGNISEWRPVLIGINSGKGKSATELRHMELNTLYHYGTKTPIDLEDLYYPIFIHGEELLKDELFTDLTL